MDSFLLFFEEMPVWQKLFWIVSCIALFWVLEGYYSAFKLSYNKIKHARVNISLLAFVIIINVIFGLITAQLFVSIDQYNLGLLNYISVPSWAALLISLLILDFIAQYGVHYCLHKVKWMWRLHLVHHSDKNVDVTTGTRHHPLDFLMREFFALIAILIVGMPLAFYLFYRILSVFFTYWTHANIKLPSGVDKVLSYIIVTPKMHKFHHHQELPWTDSNYGNMLSIWDRIFGTFVYGDDSKIVYGVDIANHVEDQNLPNQLLLPFNKTVKSKS